MNASAESAMTLTLKNFGAFKGEASIEPKSLTIFSGANNSGKTYAMYVLWALYQRRLQHSFEFSNQLADDLRDRGTIRLNFEEFFTTHWNTIQRGVSDALKRELKEIFRAPTAQFADAGVVVRLSKQKFLAFARKTSHYQRRLETSQRGFDVRFSEQDGGMWLSISLLGAKEFPHTLVTDLISALVIEIVLSAYAREAFLLPAERGGLNLFYLDLDAKNSALVRHLKREEANPIELLQDMMVAQYAQPIDSYISFLKRAPRVVRKESDFHDEALRLQKNVAKVRYKVTKEGVITAKPYRSSAELGFHLTSSTVKNFYGLWAWLEGHAQRGDCLMIDEPELNLHPDNQRLIARLLVRLVNRGVRVIISTHSDYVVREINNMIMLANEFPGRPEVEQRFGYASDGCERLASRQVSAYHFSEQGVVPSTISTEFGVEVASMDEAINRLNQSNSEIYFAVAEHMHPIQDAAEVATPRRR